MYGRADVAVDKGLGFDFSSITDLVKTALPVSLNIFQNQMRLNQMKSNPYGTQSPYGMPNPYGGSPYIPTMGLPASQMYGMAPQPNLPQYGYQQSSMFSTSTMLAIGAAAVVGLLAYKLLK